MKKLRLFGMIFIGLILFAVSTYYGLGQDEPTGEWVARYNGPENVKDGANAIAVDSEGNVYVTGQSGGGAVDDYATIKYDKNGNQVWIDYYNGPKDAGDVAYDIAVDSAGNVYVTGESDYGTMYGTRCDYCTIKYDIDGNRLWVARYHNTESFGNYIPNDFGLAVAVHEDPYSGKVFIYVTGMSYGATEYGGITSDYATIKYDGETGTELWHARYDGGENDGTYPRSIAVDSAGNVYVTGWSEGVGTGYDAATVKYDKDGNEMWVARYNGSANRYDEGDDIAVDSAGNVYVTGWSIGIGTNYDCVTIKYEGESGNPMWYGNPSIDENGAARYNGPGNGVDGANEVAVDSAGNVYVTGLSMGVGTGTDYATIKYDTNGNQMWVDRYNGAGNYNDYASALAVDSAGNVYITGYSMGVGTGMDYATIKYDTNGNQMWVDRYNGPENLNDTAGDIALDSAGNVYVTGWSYGSETDFDYATIKYSQFLSVQIDIKPGEYPNVINLGSNGNIPVAILSTADFDATTVDPTTITLAGADVRLKGNGSPLFSLEDANGDGLLDILVHVNTSAFELTNTDTEAVLEGETFDGVRIRGVDSIRIVPL